MSEGTTPTGPESSKPMPPLGGFNIPPIDWTELKITAKQTLQSPNPPEIEQAKAFYQRHKATIITGVTCVVIYKLNKHAIKKVVVKAIRADSEIVKHHLNQLTMATEDLAQMSHEVRFGKDSFLRGVTDGVQQ